MERRLIESYATRNELLKDGRHFFDRRKANPALKARFILIGMSATACRDDRHIRQITHVSLSRVYSAIASTSRRSFIIVVIVSLLPDKDSIHADLARLLT